MATNNPIVIGVGEILWDILPSDRKLGGAPANFAYHAQALGADAAVVSAVGNDAMGREINARLQTLRIESRYLQINRQFPTGTVDVKLQADGNPHYAIPENVAWDNITWNGELAELALSADAVCIGSLAQRSPVSRNTIQAFLKHTRPQCLRIFDLNLRQAFYTRQIIDTTLRSCNLLKLNDEEWPVIAGIFHFNPAVPEGLVELFSRYPLQCIALTEGAQGSLLVTPTTTHRHPAASVQVVDTVGAGDAFTASLAIGLLAGRSLPDIHTHASTLSAYVCTQRGATPPIPRELIQSI